MGEQRTRLTDFCCLTVYDNYEQHEIAQCHQHNLWDYSWQVRSVCDYMVPCKFKAGRGCLFTLLVGNSILIGDHVGVQDQDEHGYFVSAPYCDAKGEHRIAGGEKLSTDYS